MADLVLGLAKSAVEGTVTMVKSAIEEEKKLQKGVQRDLILISDEFEMMQSFLVDVKDHVTNNVTRTMVTHVRDMALDLEDCIETVVYLGNKPNWWRRMLSSCMQPPRGADLDNAVAVIELLKARVEGMGQRNLRYRHIAGSGSKPPDQMHHQAMPKTAKKEKSPLDLTELITKEIPQLQVISVLGTGSDLGMMPIKKAYDDPKTCNSFRCRAWVRLTHPFNPLEFIRCLLAQFYKTYYHPSSEGSVVVPEPMKVMGKADDVLIADFMTQINLKYLVVLEGVSSMVDWEAVRVYLPDKNGSCIIVHTQQLGIASLCVGHPHRVSELEQYSDDDSVFVLLKKDGRNGYAEKKKAACDCLREQYVGRMDDLHAIDFLTSFGKEFKVTSVWGISGVGKASLVKRIYSNRVANEWKHPDLLFGWVTVAHPFNLRDLSQSLFLDLHGESVQPGSMPTVKDPHLQCRELLREYRCNVVIEGLQSTEEWDLVRDALALGSTKSSIIVITNKEQVAKYCATETDRVWNVKSLEAHDALHLFKQHCDPDKIDDGRLILNKCGGFPKVIVAVACYLALDNLRSGWGPTKWKSEILGGGRFMHELETNKEFSRLQGLFAWVHSYFRTCPDFLKPCIFYLSIFPLSQRIRRRRLVRRWIAEGYSRDTKEITAEDPSKERGTAEDTVEDFFSKLVQLSMIQELEAAAFASDLNLRMKWCQVNGFFREYIMSRPMEENLVCALEGSGSLNLRSTRRHLTIGSNWVRDRNVFETIDFSRMRSLTVFGKWEPFFMSDRMKVLRVLDLEDASGVTDEDLEQMVKLLTRLKFLSLRGCEGIKRLPNSLGKLLQLQTLDIRGTSIIKLPKSIIKLHKLQYVRAGTSPPLNNNTGMVQDAAVAAAAGTATASTSTAAAAPVVVAAGAATEAPAAVAAETTAPVAAATTAPTMVAAATEAPSAAAAAIEAAAPVAAAAAAPAVVAAETEAPAPAATEAAAPVQAAATTPTVVAAATEAAAPVPAAATAPAVVAVATEASAAAATEAAGPVAAATTTPAMAAASTEAPAVAAAAATEVPAAAVTATEAAAVATSPAVVAAPATVVAPAATAASAPMNKPPGTLVSNWLSKCRRHRRLDDGSHMGVKVPRGMDKLWAIYTLGVVNLGRSTAFLEELKKLAQLRKLGVSGINRDNIRKFFSAISGHRHLESLSMQLEDKDSQVWLEPDGLSFEPLKMLRSLKLYGLVGRVPEWIKKFENLKKLKLQTTKLPQKEIDSLQEKLPKKEIIDSIDQDILPGVHILRFCSTDFEDGQLHFGVQHSGFYLVDIACNSRLKAVEFRNASYFLEVLKISCFGDVSSLQFRGLDQLDNLKEVRLCGSYSDVLKMHLQSQLEEHPKKVKKPVLKLEEPRLSA